MYPGGGHGRVEVLEDGLRAVQPLARVLRAAVQIADVDLHHLPQLLGGDVVDKIGEGLVELRQDAVNCIVHASALGLTPGDGSPHTLVGV